MKLFKKCIISFTVILPILVTLINVNAATLSASKTFKSNNYSGAYCNTTAKASCPNTGTFKFSKSVTDSRKGSLYYSVYRLGDTWSINNDTKKATYNWKCVAYKLPTGASGASTLVATETGTAKFTYDSSTKKLSVQ